jgi:hypothetical protein
MPELHSTGLTIKFFNAKAAEVQNDYAVHLRYETFISIDYVFRKRNKKQFTLLLRTHISRYKRTQKKLETTELDCQRILQKSRLVETKNHDSTRAYTPGVNCEGSK